MTRLLVPLLFVAAALTACSAPEDTRPGQPVKTRQQAFKALLRSFEPMNKMMKEDRYDADAFALMAADLMSKRDAPWSYFGPDTNYPPTKAKPAVWQEATGFEQAKKDFLTATDALSVAAQAKDKARIEDLTKQVYETCKSCHDRFRQP